MARRRYSQNARGGWRGDWSAVSTPFFPTKVAGFLSRRRGGFGSLRRYVSGTSSATPRHRGRMHGPSDSSSSNSAHTRVRLTFAWHRHELYSRRNNQTHCLSNKNALSHCFPSLLESDLEPADCAPKIRQPNLLRRLLHLPSVQGHLRLSYERADFVLLSPWRPTR